MYLIDKPCGKRGNNNKLKDKPTSKNAKITTGESVPLWIFNNVDISHKYQKLQTQNQLRVKKNVYLTPKGKISIKTRTENKIKITAHCQPNDNIRIGFVNQLK